jgi:hypothetical protein
MKSYRVTTTIRSTPEAIWKILTDAGAYPSWDPTYAKIEGRIALGETITLHHAEMSPKILPMKVTALESGPPESQQWRMVWTGGGMPEAMFKGERIFGLTPRDGEVEFLLRLEFSGLMAPVITKGIPNLEPHMERFAAALKKRAEGS